MNKKIQQFSSPHSFGARHGKRLLAFARQLSLLLMVLLCTNLNTQAQSSCSVGGITVTATGTTSAAYSSSGSPNFICGQQTFSGSGAWTGYSVGSYLTYTFSSPVNSAVINWSAVDDYDVGSISTNSGGSLTLSNPCGVSISGSQLSGTPFGPGHYGDPSVTVSSNIPFTTVTVTNVSGTSGWVQGNLCNFSVSVACTAPYGVFIGGSNASYCQNSGSATLTAFSSGSPATSYAWYANGSYVSGGSTYTPPTNTTGTFNYTVTVTNACGSASANGPTITVFPTPAAPTIGTVIQPTCTVNGTVNLTGLPSSGANYIIRNPGGTLTTTAGSTYSDTNVPSDNYTYTVVNSSGCPSAPSVPVTLIGGVVNIKNQPSPATQTICVGGNISINGASTSASNASLQWQYYNGTAFVNLVNGTSQGLGTVAGATNANGAASVPLTITGATLAAGTQYQILFTNSCGSVTSNTATATVQSPVVFTVQPLPQTVCANGGTAVFTATATNGTSYQWQASDNNGTSWFTQADQNAGSLGVFSGSTTNTLTYANITNAALNGRILRLTATNSCGTVNSNSALLTENAPPSISSQPANTPQSICVGTTLTVSASASGTGITSQWQYYNGTAFVNLVNGASQGLGTVSGSTGVGNTTNTLTVSNTTVAAGTRYRIVYTNTGCTPVISNEALITVNSPSVFTTQPSPQTVCTNGSTAVFTATANSATSYQWQYSYDGGANYYPQADQNAGSTGTFTGSTTNTLTISNISSTAMDGRLFRLIATNGVCSTTSSAGLLTEVAPPVIASQPFNTPQTLCAGATLTLSASVNGTGITKQWQYFNGTTFVNIVDGTSQGLGTVSGSAGAVVVGQYDVLTVSNTTVAAGTRYRIVYTNTGCTPVISNEALITVNPAIVFTVQPSPQTVCANGGNATFTATATNATSYQWQASDNNGTSWFTQADQNAGSLGVFSGSTTNTLTYANITNAALNGRILRLTATNGCGTVTSNSALLTENTPVNISTQPTPTTQTLCAGSNISINGACSYSPTITGGSTPGASLQWQYFDGASFVNLVNGTSQGLGTVAGAANANGSASVPLTITGATVAATTQYRIIFTNACGSVTSNTATATVSSPIVFTTQPSPQTVCANGSNAVFTATATNATSYQWQASDNNGTSWFTQADQNAGSLGVFSGSTTNTLTYANITNAALNGRILRLTATNGCGTVTSNSALLTEINCAAGCTPPLLSTSAGVCNGTTYSVTFNSSGTVTASAGTVSGNTISGIPVGTNVTLTATAAGGCANTAIVPSPASCSNPPSGCVAPVLAAGNGICGGAGTYSVVFNVSSGATVTASSGTISGNTVTGVALGTNLTLTASSGSCASSVIVTSPANCSTACAAPGASFSMGICSGNTYSVNFIKTATTTVTANAGTVGTGSITGIPIATSVSVTSTTSGCSAQTKTIVAPTKVAPQLIVGNPACNGTTYSVTYVSNGTVTSTDGVVSANMVSGIPSGNSVTLTATAPNGCATTAATVAAPPSCTNPPANCNPPTISAGNGACNGTGAYNVAFSATSGATITASAGTVSGNTVTGITIGTNVTITATNGTGCSNAVTVNSPADCSTPCATPAISKSLGACNGSTYTVNFSNPNGATVTASAGTVGASSITGIPIGTSVTVRASTGTCADQIVTIPSPAKTAPVLSAGNPVCNGATYEVTFSSNGTVTASSGTVSGNKVSGITSGTSLTLTSTSLNSCATSIITVTAPPSCTTPVYGCTPPSLTSGQGVCQGTGTYNVAFSATPGATITASAGTVSGNAVTGIIIGTNVTITATSSAGCSTAATVTSPVDCSTPCATAALSSSLGACNGTTYSVNFSTLSGTTVTSSAGTVGANSVTGIAIGTAVTLRASNGTCTDQVVTIPSPANCDAQVQLRVFLQGSYTSGATMRNDLYTGTNAGSNLLPLSQPYTGTAYGPKRTKTGVETVAALPATAVDWVLVQLRSTATGATVASRAGILLQNGYVVDTAVGFGKGMRFPGVSAGSYYIVVSHRNHLSVMSAATVTLNPQSVLYDFTTSNAKGYNLDGVNTPMVQLAGGLFGLWGGDVNHDGQVYYYNFGNDPDALLNTYLGGNANSGYNNLYENGDANMDGQTYYYNLGNDRDWILNIPLSGNANNGYLEEQVP